MIAGPPTKRIFRPALRVAIMPSATAATVSSFGRSADTSLDMKPNTDTGILARRRHDLHGCLVHEHAIALAHLVHRHGHRVRAVGRVAQHDAAVHFDLLDRGAIALVADMALEVRRRVEVVGEHAVGRGRHPLGVVRHGRGAVLAHLLQDVVQGVHVRRAHDDSAWLAASRVVPILNVVIS